MWKYNNFSLLQKHITLLKSSFIELTKASTISLSQTSNGRFDNTLEIFSILHGLFRNNLINIINNGLIKYIDLNGLFLKFDLQIVFNFLNWMQTFFRHKKIKHLLNLHIKVQTSNTVYCILILPVTLMLPIAHYYCLLHSNAFSYALILCLLHNNAICYTLLELEEISIYRYYVSML